ncbi:hypothetical protein CDAR_576621 [Caerostris darwini]|uniref:Uncharacterized protein n=1 Tax=Caerostris darwini TaxID=1538125 RepID=A0AAV4THT8_9ARAC|nr:hypothetical protein CDAR_576621 [Caerostris darwini]
MKSGFKDRKRLFLLSFHHIQPTSLLPALPCKRLTLRCTSDRLRTRHELLHSSPAILRYFIHFVPLKSRIWGHRVHRYIAANSKNHISRNEESFISVNDLFLFRFFFPQCGFDESQLREVCLRLACHEDLVAFSLVFVKSPDPWEVVRL